LSSMKACSTGCERSSALDGGADGVERIRLKAHDSGLVAPDAPEPA
jgi:hypothetical protein